MRSGLRGELTAAVEVENRDIRILRGFRLSERGLDDPVACEVGAGDEVIKVLAYGAVAGSGENE